jgi:hypothetical protein
MHSEVAPIIQRVWYPVGEYKYALIWHWLRVTKIKRKIKTLIFMA